MFFLSTTQNILNIMSAIVGIKLISRMENFRFGPTRNVKVLCNEARQSSIVRPLFVTVLSLEIYLCIFDVRLQHFFLT